MFENTPRPPKLLDQLRDKMRLKHYSVATERQYIHWAKRFNFSMISVIQKTWD